MKAHRKAAIDQFTTDLNAILKKQDMYTFRDFLRGCLESNGLPTEMELPVLRALIGSYAGLKSLAQPHTPVSYGLRSDINDFIACSHSQRSLARYVLNSDVVKTWAQNDNGKCGFSDFLTRLQAKLGPMAVIGNRRKIGDVMLTGSIEDNYDQTPQRSLTTVFVDHSKDGTASLAIISPTFGKMSVDGLVVGLCADLFYRSEHENGNFSYDPDTRLSLRKKTVQAHNRLVHASRDLTKFFQNASITPLHPEVVAAMDSALKNLAPHGQKQTRGQPYFSYGGGAAL